MALAGPTAINNALMKPENSPTVLTPSTICQPANRITSDIAIPPTISITGSNPARVDITLIIKNFNSLK